MAGALPELREKLASLDTHVAVLENRVDTHGLEIRRLREQGERLTAVESRVDAIETMSVEALNEAKGELLGLVEAIRVSVARAEKTPREVAKEAWRDTSIRERSKLFGIAVVGLITLHWLAKASTVAFEDLFRILAKILP